MRKYIHVKNAYNYIFMHTIIHTSMHTIIQLAPKKIVKIGVEEFV